MSTTTPLGPIERWPKWLFVIPFVAQWLLLSVQYRSLTLPSAANPDIETGGMVGESKQACLGLIHETFRQWVAHSTVVQPGQDAEVARLGAALSYPLIAKPDIGWCGYGVRRIDDQTALMAYQCSFPAAAFMLQRLIDDPGEAGLLYIRQPSAAAGRITAITLRHPPQVVGDGLATLAGLIAANPRTAGKAKLYQLTPSCLARVPQAGEIIRLMTVASLRVGGRYEDVTEQVTPALEVVLDNIARSMGRFHYGRFDVRFTSMETLREGLFTIIEVNGAGSEAIQNWDPQRRLWQSFSGVFAKQRELFALADKMRQQGVVPVGWRAVVRAHLYQQHLMSTYPYAN